MDTSSQDYRFPVSCELIRSFKRKKLTPLDMMFYLLLACKANNSGLARFSDIGQRKQHLAYITDTSPADYSEWYSTRIRRLTAAGLISLDNEQRPWDITLTPYPLTSYAQIPDKLITTRLLTNDQKLFYVCFLTTYDADASRSVNHLMGVDPTDTANRLEVYVPAARELRRFVPLSKEKHPRLIRDLKSLGFIENIKDGHNAVWYMRPDFYEVLASHSGEQAVPRRLPQSRRVTSPQAAAAPSDVALRETIQAGAFGLTEADCRNLGFTASDPSEEGDVELTPLPGCQRSAEVLDLMRRRMDIDGSPHFYLKARISPQQELSRLIKDSQLYPRDFVNIMAAYVIRRRESAARAVEKHLREERRQANSSDASGTRLHSLQRYQQKSDSLSVIVRNQAARAGFLELVEKRRSIWSEMPPYYFTGASYELAQQLTQLFNTFRSYRAALKRYQQLALENDACRDYGELAASCSRHIDGMKQLIADTESLFHASGYRQVATLLKNFKTKQARLETNYQAFMSWQAPPADSPILAEESPADGIDSVEALMMEDTSEDSWLVVTVDRPDLETSPKLSAAPPKRKDTNEDSVEVSPPDPFTRKWPPLSQRARELGLREEDWALLDPPDDDDW